MTNMPDTLYGADASGLICGFVFDAQGRGLAIDGARALQWLGDAPATGFVWLHFNLAHTAAAKWMQEQLQLSALFHESLRDGSSSTRVEMDDDMLVAVVNDVP